MTQRAVNTNSLWRQQGGVGDVAISLCHCRAAPTKTNPPCFFDPEQGELLWKVQGLPPSGRALLHATFPPGALHLAGGHAIVKVSCILNFSVDVAAAAQKEQQQVAGTQQPAGGGGAGGGGGQQQQLLL